MAPGDTLDDVLHAPYRALLPAAVRAALADEAPRDPWARAAPEVTGRLEGPPARG